MNTFVVCFITVVALCATQAADARKHDRTPKQAVSAATTKPAVIPVYVRDRTPTVRF